MVVRPCFYLRSWEASEKEALSKISDLGFPVLVHGEDVQKSSKSLELLQVFQKNHLEILSFDVDDHRDHLEVAFKACAIKERTHLIYVDQFSEAVMTELLQLPHKIIENPWAQLSLVNLQDVKKHQNKVMQRALDLGEQDYRELESALCAYPVFLVQNISLKKNSVNNHLRILLSMLWRGHEVQAIQCAIEPTKNTYRFWSQFETHCFRFCLMALSSLHSSKDPKHSALSCAWGAFIACTPFYGIQSFLIFLGCFVFRLNFLVAFIGSQVSIPPIYAVLVPIQLYLGFSITGKKFEFEGEWLDIAQDHFTAWLVGSLVVGGVVAALIGFLWYGLQSRKGKKKKAAWTGKMRGGKYGNQFVIKFLKVFGLKPGYFLLFFIVPYFYIFSPKARRGLNEYWKIQNPKMSLFKRQYEVLKHFFTFAQTLVDQAYQSQHKELVFNIYDEKIDAMQERDKSKPLIILFSHFGGWGMATLGFSRRFLGNKVHMIRYRTDGLSSEKMFEKDSDSGLQNIYLKPGEPLFMPIHNVLGGKGIMALMGDRPADTNFELKCFFGKLTPVPTTPFRLAKTYKANVNFVWGKKESGIDYSIVTESVDSEKVSQDQVIEKYLRYFEDQIKQKPHQWFNFYSYWSVLPTMPNGELCLPQKYELTQN